MGLDDRISNVYAWLDADFEYDCSDTDLFAYVPKELVVLTAENLEECSLNRQIYLFGWAKGQEATLLQKRESSLYQRANLTSLLSHQHNGCKDCAFKNRKIIEAEALLDRTQLGPQGMDERLGWYFNSRDAGEIGDAYPFVARLTKRDVVSDSIIRVPEDEGLRGADVSTIRFLHARYGKALFLGVDALNIIDVDRNGDAIGERQECKAVACVYDNSYGYISESPSAQRGSFDAEKRTFKLNGKA